MTLMEKIRQRILKFLKIDKLSDNPNSDRYTFLGNKDEVIRSKVQEFKVWYYGNSNELLNFYTAQDVYGNVRNPIYNRDKMNYFWSLSAEETSIKRIHSGLPYAIVSTITNIVGTPNITCESERLDYILKKTDLMNIINQKQLPMTLALGWGAFKPIIDTNVSPDCPLVEWYNADDVEFVVKHGVIIGIIYKDYYNYDGKDYVLLETRRVLNGDSIIEYNLYRYDKSDQVVEVELDTIPELASLNKDGLVIRGLNRVLGVPSRFFYDMNNENYGRSIFEGKIDMFDDLDQDLSQASLNSRQSGAITYYPVDLLDRGADGLPRTPDVYNRTFIKSNSYPNGDGELSGEIKVDQPVVNFAQYIDKILSDMNIILTGQLSPATLGLNIAKDDTALSQREKEKISIMMRNNIIDREESIDKELFTQLLILDEYINTGSITKLDYEISVKFNEFANPTFEQKSNTLTPMLNSGAISPEMFIEKLYGDSLSEEEKQKEIAYIKEKQQQDNIDISEFENEGTITGNSIDEGKGEKEFEGTEQPLS